MSWRDRLAAASFRGVSFHVERSELAGGRRTAKHEYPFRPDPFIEDMGRKARMFPVEGFVLGADYMVARDALLDALEQPGVGELVHPYHGTRRVICSAFTVTESSTEGGVARFGLTFEETPAQPPSPSIAPAAADVVSASASAARAAASAEFTDAYQPGTLMDGPTEALRLATLTVESVAGTIQAPVDVAADLRSRIDRLLSSTAALARLPAALLSDVTGILDILPSAEALLAAYGFDPGPRPPDTTTNRRAERANYDALVAAIRVLSIARAAQMAAAQTHESYDAAVAQRDLISDRLDEQAGAAGDATYAALVQLRADLTRAVPGDASDLPRLLRVTPEISMPALVLAQRLYGDASRDAEVAARNGVSHPGFLTGGIELEVLSA